MGKYVWLVDDAWNGVTKVAATREKAVIEGIKVYFDHYKTAEDLGNDMRDWHVQEDILGLLERNAVDDVVYLYEIEFVE